MDDFKFFAPLPVVRGANYSIAERHRPKEEKPKIDDLKTRLPKGKYDIHYMIAFCRIIEEKCEAMKMRPQDLVFSLRESLKTLRVTLEMERDYPDTGGVKMYRCDACNEVFEGYESKSYCPSCAGGKKWIGLKESKF